MPPHAVSLKVDRAPLYGKLYTYTEMWNGRRFQHTSTHPHASESVVRHLVRLSGTTHSPPPRPRAAPVDVPREM